MTDIEKRLQTELPPVPAAFQIRHDDLLHNLTQKEDVIIKRKLSISLGLAIVLLVLAIGTAIAASLGTFGQIAGKDDLYNADDLARLEGAAKTYTQVIDIEGLDKYNGPNQFIVDQAYYDGESLYVSSTLANPTSKLEFIDASAADGVEWNYTSSPEHLNSWKDRYNSEDLAAIEERIAADGIAVFIEHDQFIGDGAALADGTYINPYDTDQVVGEDGSVKAYTGFQFPLPENAQNKDSLDLVFTFMRSATLHAITADSHYTCYAYGERKPTQDLHIHIVKSADVTKLMGEATHEDYSVSADMTLNGITIRGMITCKVPDAWLEYWTSYEPINEEIDMLMNFNLYVDGVHQTNGMEGRGAQDGAFSVYMDYRDVGEFEQMSLRPVFFLTGEHADEEIKLK